MTTTDTCRRCEHITCPGRARPGILCPACDRDGGPCKSPTARVPYVSRAQQLRWLAQADDDRRRYRAG